MVSTHSKIKSLKSASQLSVDLKYLVTVLGKYHEFVQPHTGPQSGDICPTQDRQLVQGISQDDPNLELGPNMSIIQIMRVVL